MKTVRSIGRYRVEGLLGTGAMGEVYRAYDPIIDRPVAIKVVRTELAAGSGSEQWLQRFRREARAAGRRFHPNIVAILDFGEDDGMPFLAMEYVDGRSLDAILKTSGPLDPARSVAVITQVLSALGFAHQNGIVHRDVKPSNIMVLNSGEVKVADFGIARSTPPSSLLSVIYWGRPRTWLLSSSLERRSTSVLISSPPVSSCLRC